MRDGVLTGWVQDEAIPERPVEIEALVDGTPCGRALADRFRADLARNGIGEGRHGFAVALPAAAFDGRPHDVAARVVATGALLRRPVIGVVLSPAERPEIRGAVVACAGGRIVGYCRDLAAPDRKTRVDVWCDGALRLTLSADLDPGHVDVPAGHGFAFDLADVVEGDALVDEVVVRPWGGGAALVCAFGHLGRAAAAIEIDEAGPTVLRGRLVVPGPVREDAVVELLLDGVPVAALAGPWVRSGMSLFDFAAPLWGARRGRSELTARLGGGGAALPNARVEIRAPGDDNLLDNPCFEAWREGAPERWSTPDPRTALAPVAPPLSARTEADLRFGAGAVRVAAVGGSAVLLRQTVDLRGLPAGARALDFLTCLRAAEPCTLTVRLEQRDQDGVDRAAEAQVSAWPHWSAGRARLSLLDERLAADAEFSIAVAGRAPAFVDVALAALGAPGFTPPAPAVRPRPAARPSGAEPANAVLNGDLAVWGRLLRHRMTSRRFEFAEGWFVTAKIADSAVEVRLDRRLVRDPVLGVEPREEYGVALAGPVARGYLRLEARLDPLQFRLGALDELTFYARPLASVARIDRVFAMLRRRGDDGSSGEARLDDSVVTEILRDVDVPAEGGIFRTPLGSAAGGRLREVALQVYRDPALEILLVFEFTGPTDCFLARVRLGTASPAATGAATGHLALEDGRIARQIGRLRTIGHWAAPTAVPAAASGARRLATAPARWRRDGDGFGSVEIVVCVHNAADDTLRCLDSLLAHTGTPHFLTVVNDGSDAPTTLALDAFATDRPWVRVTTNPTCIGYTRSANLGMAGATADWIVLLNSDTIVTPGWLDGMIACARSDPAIRFVGPLSNAASWQSVPEAKDLRNNWRINQLPEDMTPADMAALVREVSRRAYPRVPLLNGFCTMMHRETLARLGYLDETTFPVGFGEESDLCLRATKAGHALAVADDVYVHHAKSASFGSDRRKELSRAGNRALAGKHPDVRLADVERELAETIALIELRRALRQRIEGAPLAGTAVAGAVPARDDAAGGGA